MQRIGSQLLGLDQGEVTVFADFENAGPMWTGAGPREARQRVRFSGPFFETPIVIVGFAMIDGHRDTNLRIEARAENIDLHGFDAVVGTWGDTLLAQARLAWTALGALKHEEDWQL